MPLAPRPPKPDGVKPDSVKASARVRRALGERVLRLVGALVPAAANMLGARLIHEGRLSEAEALMARAVARFPRRAGVLETYALTAHFDGRFAEAAERWSAACLLRPDLALPWVRLAACRRALGDVPAARAAIAEALALAPNAIGIMTEAGHIFDLIDEPERSLPLWERVVEEPGAPTVVWQAYIKALARIGRLDEADATLRRAFALYPDDRHLVAARAIIAERRDDWERAFDIWSRYTAMYRDDKLGPYYHERAATMMQLQRAERRQPAFAAPLAIEQVKDDETRQLLLGFESIGEDCEFGSVQRRWGAEPLGLLRWNDVAFPSLAAALEARFAGMGDPETTYLDVGPIGEVYVRDRRWDLGMHTFLFKMEVSLDALLPRMRRRLVYLRDKFLEDLSAGEKIIVFKTDDVSIDQLEHLHALLKGFGPARLLHVRRAGWAGIQGWPRAGVGEVVALAPDLYVGYLSRMGELENMPFDEWVALCRAAAATMAHVFAT